MLNRLSIALYGLCLAFANAMATPLPDTSASSPSVPPPATAAAASRPDSPNHAAIIVEASRQRITLGETYDPTYYAIAYPGGDVANDRGVCTDVVIRAYRHIGIDFQKLIHEDMRRNFPAYPQLWGNASTDRNIDHRRVPNIETFLKRKGAALRVSDHAADYLPGDLVTWRLPGGLPHIGIVSDRTAPGSERLLILHNIGAGTSEDDILFAYPINGHFRYFPDPR